MILANQPIPTEGVLVVSCGSALSDEAKRAAQAYAFSPNVEDAALRLANATFECVIACVDPIKNDSMSQLEELRKATKPINIPIVTISRFNPNWIENLVVQFGAFAHFKRFPDKSQISSIAEIHARARRTHR